MKHGESRIIWALLLDWMTTGCGKDREKVLPLYSPDKLLRLEVRVGPVEGVRFSITWKGEKIITESGFKLDLDGFPDFLRGMTEESIRMGPPRENLTLEDFHA